MGYAPFGVDTGLAGGLQELLFNRMEALRGSGFLRVDDFDRHRHFWKSRHRQRRLHVQPDHVRAM